MTRVCPQCSTPNTDQAAACTRCGFRFTISAPNYTMPPQSYQQGYQQPQQGYTQYPQPQPPAYQQPQWQSPPPGQYPPMQPGTYANAPAPKAKRGPGLWIALVLVVLLLGGGGYALYTFVFHGGGQGPAGVLNAFCNDLKNNNPQDAYSLLSSNAQKSSTEQQVQTALQTLSALGGIKSCTVSDVQVNGSQASGKVTVTYNAAAIANKGVTQTVNLVQENGSWKIDTSGLNGSN